MTFVAGEMILYIIIGTMIGFVVGWYFSRASMHELNRNMQHDLDMALIELKKLQSSSEELSHVNTKLSGRLDDITNSCDKQIEDNEYKINSLKVSLNEVTAHERENIGKVVVDEQKYDMMLEELDRLKQQKKVDKPQTIEKEKINESDNFLKKIFK